MYVSFGGNEIHVPKTKGYLVIKTLGGHKAGEIINLSWNNDTWDLIRKGFIERMDKGLCPLDPMEGV